MGLTWSARRQLLYYAVVFVVLGIVLYAGYGVFFTSKPTCFDRTQNQNEEGVDCGGSCALLCQAGTRSPILLWSRAFEVAPGTYTAAAYIQNPNTGAGAKRVAYSFQLFDDKNLLVVEREGTIDLPPIENIPVLETGIDVGTRKVTKALFTFASEPVWFTPTDISPTLRVTEQRLEKDGTQLSARLVNDALVDARRVTVVAVLYGAQGSVLAASKSTVTVPKKGSQEVSFTWPQGTPGVVRAEITVLPVF